MNLAHTKYFAVSGVFLILYLLVWHAPVDAGHIPEVKGSVKNELNTGIPDVFVKWTDNMGSFRYTKTDQDGHFRFPAWILEKNSTYEIKNLLDSQNIQYRTDLANIPKDFPGNPLNELRNEMRDPNTAIKIDINGDGQPDDTPFMVRVEAIYNAFNCGGNPHTFEVIPPAGFTITQATAGGRVFEQGVVSGMDLNNGVSVNDIEFILTGQPEEVEPEKKQSSSTEIDSPDDVGLSADLKWACTRSQSCADEPEPEIETDDDDQEDGQRTPFTQDVDNAQTGFCSPEAKKEENAPYTAIIPGVGNQMQRNGVSEENTGLWVLQCFNVPRSVDPETGQIETEIICTTGSATSDERAFDLGVLENQNNWTDLVSEFGIQVEIYGLYQNTQDNANPDREPITFPLNPPEDLQVEIEAQVGSGARTNIAEDIEWTTRFDPGKDVPASMKDYFFLMVFTQYGDRTSQQNETYSQNQATLNTQTGCSLIQDPYGTVFDSYTLEPLSDASVQLLRDNGTNYVPVTQSDAPAVTRNPLITTENGSFAFFVPDGRYKLEVSREGYTFPGKSSALNPSYDQLYSDIYQGEDIVQHGEIEHRDVPLDPVDKEAAEAYAEENPVQIISFLQSIDREHQEYVIQGRTTHPKAKVTVYGKEAVPGGGFRETREIERTEADMDGRFEVRIGLTTLQKGEVIGDLEVVKKKITPRLKSEIRNSKYETNTKFQTLISKIRQFFSSSLQPTASSLVSHVQAAEIDNDRVRIPLDPILNTVKGYAKDDSGETLPNTTVGIYVPMSETPVYETMTDEEGYFEIPSEELPNIEYEIRYEGKTGKVVQTSTSQFMAQNSDFISNENVDVYAYTPGDTNQEPVVLGATDQVNSLNRQSIFIAVAAVLGILILSSITILGMYAYRHKKIR